jgi:hypothetical protein
MTTTGGSPAARLLAMPQTWGLWHWAALAFATRTAISAYVGGIPPMDPLYVTIGRSLVESSARFPISFQPAYAIALIGFHAALGSWILSTHALYVVSSTWALAFFYLLAKDLVNRSAANWAAFVFLLLPNNTAAICGYSHTGIVAFALFCTAAFAFNRMLVGDRPIPMALVGAITAALATCVRPEYVFCSVSALVLAFYLELRTRSLVKVRVRAVLACALVYALILVAHWRLLVARSSTTMSFLGNAEYGYNAFVDTVALRLKLPMEDRTPGYSLFGTGEENGFSVLRAIVRHPKEEVKNLVFNAISLLKSGGDPLFWPVFLYLPVGVSMLSPALPTVRRAHVVMLAFALPFIPELMLVHVEIRYLLPLTAALCLWAGLGLNALYGTGRRRTALTFVVALAVVLVVYIARMRLAHVEGV